MYATSALGGRRRPLDELIVLVVEPEFASLFRRAPSLQQATGHADPGTLALAPPRSRYVRQWRRHARRCPSCAEVFRYLGLAID
jgi:hypothetical protein